jgi:hypothetical protein
MYLLCDMAEDLDGAAARVREALNLPAANKPPHEQSQKRYGLNIGGGHYYLFDVLGIELCFCKNAGEVAIEEDPRWSYYLCIHSEGDFSDLFHQAEKCMNIAGIATKLLNVA